MAGSREWGKMRIKRTLLLAYPSEWSLTRNFFRLKLSFRIFAHEKVLIFIWFWKTTTPRWATARCRGTPSWSCDNHRRTSSITGHKPDQAARKLRWAKYGPQVFWVARDKSSHIKHFSNRFCWQRHVSRSLRSILLGMRLFACATFKVELEKLAKLHNLMGILKQIKTN